ncbi:adenosylcobalamin-dependent ribonucleoside-diphosphate reductase [Candidatus Dojkabacteria bacterium]|nr:adenosylcobalamin-dependent ribonucleoside-diphosphate reductase [Candidatus Dojkabacteria bacterium]
MYKKENINKQITEYIWKTKYRYKSPINKYEEKTIEDTWKRIAKELSSVERKRNYWQKEFYSILEGFKFIPAGRISAGIGTNRNVTLINTFVMPSPKDSLDSILETFKETALTLRQGGGLGLDFSLIRPKGDIIKGVEAESSGPIPFMEMWDQMCSSLMQGGVRRGAMMALLRCDHPDILEFVESKNKSGKLTKFNISVLITDDFMKALKNKKKWDLKFNGKIYKTIVSCDLWKRIMQNTYKYSEPGVIFIDQINKRSNLKYCEKIVATNSCGEQPMPEYGSSPLGSVNLTQFVENPFTKEAKFDSKKMQKVIRIAIRMLDNVISISNYPVKKQKLEANAKRRIGLGYTGVADTFAMCGLKYSSDEANDKLEELVKLLQNESYRSSAEIAKEKGSFPKYKASKYTKGYYFKLLDKEVQNDIEMYGLRNGALNCVAPTGTSSLYAGNISSGIEPIFDLEHERKILKKDGTFKYIRLEDYAYSYFNRTKKNKNIDNPFVTSNGLNPYDHLKVQAIAQRYIDGSISKTINCPANIEFDDFEEVYFSAYEAGCKGCTTYRPTKIRGSVLKTYN